MQSFLLFFSEFLMIILSLLCLLVSLGSAHARLLPPVVVDADQAEIFGQLMGEECMNEHELFFMQQALLENPALPLSRLEDVPDSELDKDSEENRPLLPEEIGCVVPLWMVGSAATSAVADWLDRLDGHVATWFGNEDDGDASTPEKPKKFKTE
jgi:hypothetical protein